jgi:hypothetical protein
MSFMLIQTLGVGLGTILGFAVQQRLQNKLFTDEINDKLD